MFHYKYQWKLGALCQRFKPYPDKVIGREVKEIMPSKNTSISIFFILKSYSFTRINRWIPQNYQRFNMAVWQTLMSWLSPRLSFSVKHVFLYQLIKLKTVTIKNDGRGNCSFVKLLENCWKIIVKLACVLWGKACTRWQNAFII